MKKNRWVDFFEGLVIVAILAVLVQTFLDDFSVVSGWSWTARRVLVFTGFGFDLFFTIEFLVRLFFALSRRRGAEYLIHERGWVDFLASIPLLLLNSGPTVLALVTGASLFGGVGGFMNVLKVVKAIRVARVLRLLRILKLLRRIKNTDSVMAQRHVGKVSTIGVSVFIFVILGFSLLSALVTLPTLQQDYTDSQARIMNYLSSQQLASEDRSAALSAYARSEPSLLLVKEYESVRYSRFGNEYYSTFFGPGDYGFERSGALSVYFDLRPLNAQQSINNLVYFAAIVILVVVFLLFYGPHFALTISDPVHVMRRGMSERGYNLEVRIPGRYVDDEIFLLAGTYNDHYLPLKDRSGHNEESGVLDLTVDDIKDLFDN